MVTAASLVYPASISWMFFLGNGLTTAHWVLSVTFLAMGFYFVGTFVGAKLHVRELVERIQLWRLALLTAVASIIWSGTLLVAASRATALVERQELRTWFAAGVCGAATTLLLGLFVGKKAARSRSWATLDKLNLWVWVIFLVSQMASIFII